MFRTIFLTVLLCGLPVLALDPECPDTFPEECSCYNDRYGTEIYCVTIVMETWNIQATFDAISEAFNNTDVVVSSVTINPRHVTTSAQEVPANSVSILKTHQLVLNGADKTARIDPEAFSGTHSTTSDLEIYEMNFHDSEEAFALINNFPKLRELYMEGVTLSQIPAHAFKSDLKNLIAISIRDAGLQSIGDLAFAQLPDPINILLDGNDLTLDNISDTAFTFSLNGVYVSLERNPGITYLPEEKFGNFLRWNKNAIYVGPQGTTCDPSYFLQCDDRIDWICDAAVARIYGYYCAEAAYLDIYDYCEQKFGNSPLYRGNLQEIKKIQIADRLHYETLKTEAEFRRRNVAISKARRQHQIQA